MRYIFLSTLLLCSLQCKADATEDLFEAIESNNIIEAQSALLHGANVHQVRSLDNHTPFTFAQAKQEQAQSNLKLFGYKAGHYASFAAITIAAILHNKIVGISSLTAYGISEMLHDENGSRTKIFGTLGLAAASIASLLTLAWRSQYKWLTGLGTAAYLFTAYKSAQHASKIAIHNMIKEKSLSLN